MSLLPRNTAGLGVKLGKVRPMLPSARWALRVAWSTNASLLIGVAVVVLVRALVPALLAVAARGLVNSTVEASTTGGGIVLVLPWLALGFLFTAAEGVTVQARRFFVHRLHDDLNCRVTADILEHAARLDVAHFEDPRFRDMLERARHNPADHVARFLTDAIGCIGDVVQVASLVGILVFIEPLILGVVAFFALPYLWFQWRLSLRHYALEHSRATKRRWSGYFVSTLTGRTSVAEVKLLGLAPMLVERFRALMSEVRDQDRIHYLRGFTGGSVFVLVTTLAIYAMFVRVVLLVVQGRLTLGDLAIFGGAATRLRNGLENLIASLTSTLERTLYVANVIEFLHTAPAVVGRGTTLPSSGRGEIVLDRVTFSYPGAKEPALEDISLRIEPGETVALVGENGAGKTTLVKLIARLYDPDRGRVLLDGVDVHDLDATELHRRIAFVFQSFGRYEASAADNIAYGDWERLGGDREAVRRLATQARVSDLIESLADGYDTQLGRVFGQTDLSGGEWQKIAVARAFAREATLLILDEPTSNLDARAEHELFSRFRELARGRTTIIVSHRFSSVRMADRIFVLDRGRIIESGTHDELLSRQGSYAQLYDLHSRHLVKAAG